MSLFREYTLSGYIESKCGLLDKIAAIDVIIDSMTGAMLDAASGIAGGVINYEMNDGQIHVKATYRGVAEMNTAIDALEKTRQRYINRFDGRAVKLQDRSAFR